MSVSSPAKRTNWLIISLVAVGVLVAAGTVFAAGFFVGRSSANAASFNNLSRGVNRGGHGAIGAIQSVVDQKIILSMRGGKTQVILISTETRLEKNYQKIGLTDFKINDQVIVIGSPNSEGEINARLVGVIDSSFRPPRAFPTSNGTR